MVSVVQQLVLALGPVFLFKRKVVITLRAFEALGEQCIRYRQRICQCKGIADTGTFHV